MAYFYTITVLEVNGLFLLLFSANTALYVQNTHLTHFTLFYLRFKKFLNSLIDITHVEYCIKSSISIHDIIYCIRVHSV